MESVEGTSGAGTVGGGLYRSGAVSIGVVYMLVAYAAMLAEPIESIRTQLQDLQRAEASLARVRELTSHKAFSIGEKVRVQFPMEITLGIPLAQERG